jgi:hypothetical protein
MLFIEQRSDSLRLFSHGGYYGQEITVAKAALFDVVEVSSLGEKLGALSVDFLRTQPKTFTVSSIFLKCRRSFLIVVVEDR